jgi:GT2 family glycosyltransferase
MSVSIMKAPEIFQNTKNKKVTILMVSYNTRDLTLRALETLFQNAGCVSLDVIVWDNASEDGSADAIANNFKQVKLVRSCENIGFAAANNHLADLACTDWLLLLNPDTETHPGAVENLLRFAQANPQAGIVGGRTVFPDGALNPASCWNRITLWSLICNATGLRRIFARSNLFNPEGIGGWARDTEREVDIVVGCFFLVSTALWHRLGGFDCKYFMYGEESDLCLRAARLGYRPKITPDAQIMHMVGASTSKLGGKLNFLMKAKATLIRDHWSPAAVPCGLALLWLWAFNHRVISLICGAFGKRGDDLNAWNALWATRYDWLRGYRADADSGLR